MGYYLNVLGLCLSALYITIDFLAMFWFMDAFAARRYIGIQFFVCLLMCSTVDFVIINYIWSSPGVEHTVANFSVFLLTGWWMYPGICKRYRVLLSTIFFVAMYLIDFSTVILCALLLKMNISAFNQTVLPVIIRGVGANLLILLICGAIKHIHSPVRSNRLRREYVVLTLLFPLASLIVLLVMLQMAFEKEYYSWLFVFCTVFLAAANLAILILLNRMEKSEQMQQKQLALEQMLQMQAKNMSALSEAYSKQRKLTHDFNAQLETLHALLQENEYDAAKNFLQSVQQKQTVRALLINTRHAILDAVLNQKAYEAQNSGIDIHVEVNDLSKLVLDPVDITTVFANLLDNAIEACISCEGEKRLKVKVVLENSLFFSIQNTCNPVKIKDGVIATTKPKPHLHGFGLENVKAILEKYNGDFCIRYKDGWFLFAGEILNGPIS